jgi:hypothetical protein
MEKQNDITGCSIDTLHILSRIKEQMKRDKLTVFDYVEDSQGVMGYHSKSGITFTYVVRKSSIEGPYPEGEKYFKDNGAFMANIADVLDLEGIRFNKTRKQYTKQEGIYTNDEFVTPPQLF